MPINECIAAVKRKHDNYTKKTLATKGMATFGTLILTLKDFIFNSKFYLQIKGCVMGTTCVSTYSDIFMSDFEDRCSYPLIKNKHNSYLHFIDDGMDQI